MGVNRLDKGLFTLFQDVGKKAGEEPGKKRTGGEKRRPTAPPLTLTCGVPSTAPKALLTTDSLNRLHNPEQDGFLISPIFTDGEMEAQRGHITYARSHS